MYRYFCVKKETKQTFFFVFQAIEKHRVYSPLPKSTKTFSIQVPIVTRTPSSEKEEKKETKTPLDQQSNELSTVDEKGEFEKPKNDDTTKLSNSSDIARNVVIESVIVEPLSTSKRIRTKKLLPKHIRDSRSQSPMMVAGARCVDPDQTSSSDKSGQIVEGTKVFAKWVERTDVRYWPGK
jgi:hypothetical protein